MELFILKDLHAEVLGLILARLCLTWERRVTDVKGKSALDAGAAVYPRK
jgi:hypothetical protein